MPFDGGFSGGSSQVTALQDFNAQLMSTFGWSSSQAYAHEGFSGMNGRTDSAEYSTRATSRPYSASRRARAEPVHVLVGQPGPAVQPPDNNGNTSSECSGVAQNSWDFTAYTVAFAKNAPVTPRRRRPPRRYAPAVTHAALPTPTSRQLHAPRPGCRTRTYVSGNVVSYSGDQWTANQWNYDEVPGGAPAPGTTTVPADHGLANHEAC